MGRTSRFASITFGSTKAQMTSLVWAFWLMASQLSTTAGMVALRSDISVGLTPDQGKRIRHQAIAVVEMAESAPPRLNAILDGQPEGTIQFHELSGVGSIGDDDEKRGDLMAGFTKAPFYGAAFVKRGLVKGVALMSRASTQPRVEYVCGLLQKGWRVIFACTHRC